jgi:hypothetical protein
MQAHRETFYPATCDDEPKAMILQMIMHRIY